MTIRTGAALVLAATLLGVATMPMRVGAQQSELSGLDAYVDKAMREWQVPGLAISVVRNDSVVLAKGYGVRELGKPERVDEHTLFAIGSCSKAFGSATVAMLVHDGKVRLDDRVQQYLPWLQLWDPWVTHEVRVRDLLAHRVGTPYTIENRLRVISLDYRDVIRRSRYMQPIAPFRDRYVYSNTMYIIAGEVVKEVSGMASWNDFVRDRIWVPLGMNRTNANILTARGTANKAMPHALIDGKLEAYEWEYADSLGSPSGGINSTAWDMAQWLRFQLGEGRFGGRQLIGTDLFREMHTPHSPGRSSARTGSPMISDETAPRFVAYGLGWLVQDYRGKKMVHHSGGASGFVCQQALLPEERLGVYVGTSASGLPEALMYWVFDAYLGAPRRDWSAIRLATSRHAEEESQRVVDQRNAARIKGTKPALPLEGYGGVYDDGGAYGEATVTMKDGKLVLRIGRLSGALEHWHHDTFLIPPFSWLRSGDPLDPARKRRAYGGMPPVGEHTFVTFVLDPSGKVDEMKVEGIAAFKRMR